MGTYNTMIGDNESSLDTFHVETQMNAFTNNNVSTNNYNNSERIPDIGQPVFMIIIYSLAYGIIFLFALFGNIIVIAVVYRNRRMHTLTNFFIVNLAVADILVAVFCIPITLLHNLFNGWRYGAFLCKATPYLQGVSVCASVNTLAAIAADRYLAICYTLEHKMTWRIAKIIMCVIWTLAFSIMVPWVLYYRLEPDIILDQVFYYCIQDWPHEDGNKIFLLVVFVACYLVPLLLIIACYVMIAVRVWTRNAPGIFRYSNIIQKSKIKVIKMLTLIVFLFGISWLPLYICFLILYLYPPDPSSEASTILIDICIPIAQWLGMSNSGMNPIIYCFFSKAIRKRTVALLSCASLSEFSRHQSRYSSTRFMSVDYTNGQISLRLNRRQARCKTGCNTNLFCESTFYD